MAGDRRKRWGVLVPVAIGAALVAVPVGAATLVTSADIVDGTIRSVDVKDGNLTSADVRNGTLTAADLAPALRSSPATVYGSTGQTPPAFALTTQVPGALASYTITVTRPGDLLLIAGGAASVAENAPSTLQAGLYLDGVAVPKSGGTGFTIPCGLPPCISSTTLSLTVHGLVIPNVSAGTHTLGLRYSTTSVIPTVVSGSLPTITVVELG